MKFAGEVWRFSLAGLGLALLGPIEEGFEGFAVQDGANTALWVVSEPISPAGFGTFPPTLTDRDAWQIGFRLARANVFVPARIRERWWVLKTSSAIFLPPNNRLRILTWREPQLPPTR